MKKIILILSLFLCFVCPLSAQTDRELLLELVKQQTTTNAKIDKLAEQQAVTTLEIKGITTEIKGIQLEIKGITTEIKGIQKNIEILFMLVLGLLAGIFGLIAMTFWDRRAELCAQ